MSSKAGSSKMKYVVAAGAVVGVGGLLWWLFSPGTASAAAGSSSGASGEGKIVKTAVVTKEQRAQKNVPYTSEYWDSIRQYQRDNKDAVIASIRARFANS